MKNKRLTREPFKLINSTNNNEILQKVDNLQIKIALAIRNQDMKSANRLATILVRSKAAQLLAVKKVITNKGYGSLGWSAERPKTNKDYLELLDQLNQFIKRPQTYRASPLYRVYIKKKVPGKFRPISVPTYIDRCIQAVYKLALDPFAESVAAKDSYGFRIGRSALWAVIRIQKLLNNPVVSIPNIILLDIEKCFDNIDHDYIIANIPFIPKNILTSWLKCGFMDSPHNDVKFNKPNILQPTEKGIPQGGIISPTIANIILDGLDLAYKETPSRKAKNYTIRFADDITILVNSHDNPKTILDKVNEKLEARGLNASKLKTKSIGIHLTHKITKFETLGFEFRIVRRIGIKGRMVQKCLTNPAPANVKEHKLAIKKVANSRCPSLGFFIKKVNPIITGFCNYFRYGNSSRIFTDLSRWLYFFVNNWLHRKKGWSYDRINQHLKLHLEHPNLPTPGGWFSYYGMWRGRKKDYRVIFLKRHASDFHIIYPNPYPQPGLNYYYPPDRQRLFAMKLAFSPKKTKDIFNRSKGLCQYCGANLFDTPYEIHHILPILYGGTDTYSNLAILCKYPCHYEITKATKGLPSTIKDCEPFINKGVLKLPIELTDLLIEE